jgi:hypothetical protein
MCRSALRDRRTVTVGAPGGRSAVDDDSAIAKATSAPILVRPDAGRAGRPRCRVAADAGAVVGAGEMCPETARAVSARSSAAETVCAPDTHTRTHTHTYTHAFTHTYTHACVPTKA